MEDVSDFIKNSSRVKQQSFCCVREVLNLFFSQEYFQVEIILFFVILVLLVAGVFKQTNKGAKQDVPYGKCAIILQRSLCSREMLEKGHSW